MSTITSNTSGHEVNDIINRAGGAGDSYLAAAQRAAGRAAARVPHAQASAAAAAFEASLVTPFDWSAPAAGPKIRPSLLLDLVRDALDPRIQVSSPGQKSYFGREGLMLWSRPGEWPVEYDPVTLRRLGRSVWEARTALFTRSESFTQDWNVPNSVLVPGYAPGPDGTMTGTRWEFTNTNIPYVGKSVAVTAGLPYTQTVRVSAGDYGAVVILFNANGFHAGTTNPSVTFDVATGTLLAPATVESYGSRYLGRGIWEFWATHTAVTTTSSFFQPLRLTTARPHAPGQHLVIYSVQLEQASSPGPYIKTEGSPVTRPAESVTINDTSWFNLAEGTIVVAAETLPFTGNQQRRAFAIGPSAATRLTVRFDGLSGVSSTIGLEGAIQCDMRSIVQLGPRVVSVFGYRKDDFAVSYDAAALVTDTSGEVLPAAGQAYLGCSHNGERLCGILRGIAVYPRRLTASELRWAGFLH